MSADPVTRSARRWWTRPWVLALGLVVLAAIGVFAWADSAAGGWWTFQPGAAPQITPSGQCKLTSGGGLQLPDGRPCARIAVPAARSHAIGGRLLMVDVLVGPTTPWEFLLAQVGLLDTVSPASTLVPASSVLGGAPASQFTCQDNEQMAAAQTYAPVAALRSFGYKIPFHYHGSLVTLVEPGSPAARAGVRCGDTVVALAGTPTPTASDLINAVEGHRPGTVVTITVRRGAAEHTYRVKLGSRPAIGGQPAQPGKGFLGIGTTDVPSYRLPFPVDIKVGNIGGPSAGLALTLGILDTVSGGHLTGGHVVAVTGTIGPNGNVGAVGGVAQKTVAVQRAGATLFLVPVSEVPTARREARPGMRVEGVTTLRQAVHDLEAIGGTVPAPAGG